MFIRLFIKTTETEKAIMVVNELLACINEDYIEYADVETEPYWKINDIIVAEVKLRMVKPLRGNKRIEFLNSISNKWEYYGEDEMLSSLAMENCNLNYNLEIINIFLTDSQ